MEEMKRFHRKEGLDVESYSSEDIQTALLLAKFLAYYDGFLKTANRISETLSDSADTRTRTYAQIVSRISEPNNGVMQLLCSQDSEEDIAFCRELGKQLIREEL